MTTKATRYVVVDKHAVVLIPHPFIIGEIASGDKDFVDGPFIRGDCMPTDTQSPLPCPEFESEIGHG
jgi:hypothetical protein